MVRNIVGVLLEAGKGNLVNLDHHLEAKIPPGPTAPARGLFLVNVEYGTAVRQHADEM
jgi:tRNA U38,U39,U40 pseudouridine synthase TruA